MYELVYLSNGEKRITYPQTATYARMLITEIMEHDDAYTLVSCEHCNNYDAYKRGCESFDSFMLSRYGKVSMDEITDEMVEDAFDSVCDAPFEFDKDIAYYVLCEHSSFKAANEFYREVTA